MYCPMGEETCSEQIRLTVKYGFIQFQCLDENSPKMQRRKTVPCIPSLALASSTSAKCMEAPTPTTCCSVNGDNSSCGENSFPRSGSFNVGCNVFRVDGDNSDQSCGENSFPLSGSFNVGCNVFRVDGYNSDQSCGENSFPLSGSFNVGCNVFPPPPPPPCFADYCDATDNFQAMPAMPGNCAAVAVLSTFPPALPAKAVGYRTLRDALRDAKAVDYINSGRARGERQEAPQQFSDVRGVQRNYRNNSSDSELDSPTTLMLRNLSQDLTQPEFAQHLIDAGYRGLFDMIYMPMNLRGRGNFGYVFVNFRNHTTAVQVVARLQSSELGDSMSSFEWIAVWSTCQGFSANVERYRNSPLMHELVPQDAKPSVYDHNGKLAMFPKPTKAIAKPRIHHKAPSLH